MKLKELESRLNRYKGKTLDDKLVKKIAKEMQDSLGDFLYSTGFEVWNAGCTHRMRSGGGFESDYHVCRYDTPLQPAKEYKRLDGALSFMQREDEAF